MHLLFDLDGTLTDSRTGIAKCIEHALLELGSTRVPIGELTKYVGPPLAVSFGTLLGTADAARINLAITAYRRRFEQVGIFENQLYPGIENALAELGGDGHTLFVVTAKPRIYATRILKKFNLAHRFCQIYGPALEDRHYSKESLIREACAEHNMTPQGAIMIGDRAEDILGAKRNALRSVAVTWGYGDRRELDAAEPDGFATSTDQLVEYIRGVA
jgi:phosphoglycolate phosphatase